MTPNEITAWIDLLAKLGPMGGGVVAMLGIAFAMMQAARNPAHPPPASLPVTRAEADKIEARLHDIEASVNQIKGALGIK